MKILLVNAVYGIGSTGKIVESLAAEFKKEGHTVLCCYGRHSSIKRNENVIKCAYEWESKIHHFFSKFTGNLYGGMFFSTRKLLKIIKTYNPDVINLHMLNGYFVNNYKLLNFLKKQKINTVLTNHSDVFLTANCGFTLTCDKWKKDYCKGCKDIRRFNGPFSLNRTSTFFKKMEEAFCDFDTLKVSNVSPWLTDKASMSPILSKIKTNVTILNPISNIFFCNSNNNPYIRFINGNSKIVFYSTANFENPEKGGQNLIEISKKMPDVTFFVKSILPCNNALKQKNLIFINEKVSQKELADFYYYADCSIILSKEETFSMVVAESLSEGTPVVGFNAGGPETIAIHKYSSFVPQNHIDDFVIKLRQMLDNKIDKTVLRELAREKYDGSLIAGQYIKLYEKSS